MTTKERAYKMTCSNESEDLSEKSRQKWPSVKSVICQLWNFKTMTLDLRPEDRDEAGKLDGCSFLTDLKDLICQKIKSNLEQEHPKLCVPAQLFRLVQCGKDLAKDSDLDLD